MKAVLGITAIPKVSHSSSDYVPNYNAAVHAGANLIIAAGYLLGDTVKKYAKQYPNIKFAITDDPVAAIGGYKNEIGITYATQEGGCLAGVLAAKEAQKMNGGKAGTIGAVGGIKIPPVDSYIAGYQYCANKAVPGTKTRRQVLEQLHRRVRLRDDGAERDRLRGPGGLPGRGPLRRRRAQGGVEAEQVGGRRRRRRVPRCVADPHERDQEDRRGCRDGDPSRQLRSSGRAARTSRLNLKNNGVGVGTISPTVPQAWITTMNQYKSQIIAGTLTPPATLSK